MDWDKIGSKFKVAGIVIHQLKKSAGTRNVSFNKATKELTIGDKEQKFIARVYEAYRKRSNPTHGIFADADKTFKDLLAEYVATPELYQFSIKASEKYKKVLEFTPSATGGFLIFADFVHSDTGERYMLVLTINNKDNYVVSEPDLVLKDVKNLDLSKVDVACMINLTRWANVEKATDGKNRSYLTFVRGNKDVSVYFLSFIDCDNKMSNTESSKRLVKAVDAYATVKNLDKGEKLKLRGVVSDFCTSKMAEDSEIHLSAISALINPDMADEFREFASSEEYEVSEVIKGDSKTLRQAKYVTYNGKYKLEFDTDLLNKEIFYNKQKNELTFTKVPIELSSLIP